MQTTKLWIEPIIGGLYILIGPTLLMLHCFDCESLPTEASSFYMVLPYLTAVIIVLAYLVGTITNDFLRFTLRGWLGDTSVRSLRGSSTEEEQAAKRNFEGLLARGNHDAVASVRGTYDTLVLFRLLASGSVVLAFVLPVWLALHQIHCGYIAAVLIAMPLSAWVFVRLHRRYNLLRNDHLMGLASALGIALPPMDPSSPNQ